MIRLPNITNVLVSLSMLLLLSGAPSTAAPAGFDEGVRAYNGRQYRQALAYFTQAARVEPANVTIHYYLGLSYQGMNQAALAKQQYEWVANNPNRSLAQQAALALQNLSRLQSSRQGSALPGQQSTGAVASAGAKLNGRLKILYFTADW